MKLPIDISEHEAESLENVGLDCWISPLKGGHVDVKEFGDGHRINDLIEEDRRLDKDSDDRD